MTKPIRVSNNIKALLEMSLRDDLIITPLLSEFLNKWDGDMSEKAAKWLYKNMTMRSRNRAASWSASGAGKCLRRQELAFLGMPVIGSADAHLQMIFFNGTWLHHKWQAILLTAGLIDSIESTFKKRSTRTRCTMDGNGTAKMGRYEGREFGLELKGRNDFQYNKQTLLGIDDQTRAQVDFSFMMTGLDLWVVINEDKNNQQIKEWVFSRDDNRVNDMRLQVKDLNRAIDNQSLHPMIPECKLQTRNGEFFKCPFGGKGGACISSGKWPSRIPKGL